jgi:hypothetical protein
MDVPPTLRTWFVVDAAVDVLTALALLAAPELVLGQLGWKPIDPIATRLVGAAMLAMGAQSYFGRDAGADVYRAMLRLKVIWTLTGAISLFVAVGAGAPPAAWAFMSMFIGFAGVWLHHLIRFRQIERFTPSPPSAEGSPLPEGEIPEGEVPEREARESEPRESEAPEREAPDDKQPN